MSLVLRDDSPLARVLQAYGNSPASNAMKQALTDPVTTTAGTVSSTGVVNPVIDDIDMRRYHKNIANNGAVAQSNIGDYATGVATTIGATTATATTAGATTDMATTATSTGGNIKVNSARGKALLNKLPKNPAKRVNDISLIHPKLQAFYKELNDWSIKNGYGAVPIGETLRSKARQEYIYKFGRVKGYGRMGHPYTWTHNSRHLHGIAMDLGVPKKVRPKSARENRWLHKAWEMGRKYGVGGIGHRNKDPYHFQLGWDKSLV